MQTQDEITHIPNGSMCCACAHVLELCHHLDFKSMPVMSVDKHDGTKIVKCSHFEHFKNGNIKTL